MSSTINASVDGIVLTASSTAAMNLATGGTNRLSIDTSGNVGIATGNLTFSSTGQRITGDFSNATASNRLLFQTSTTNGNSFVGNMPNGTGSYGAYISYNGSDPANSSSFLQGITSTDARLVSTAAGTGSLLPLTFYTGGSERMRLDTSGRLGLGSASPGTYSERFVIQSAAGTQSSAMWINPGQGSGQIGIAASGRNFKIYNTYTDGLLANGKGIDIDDNGNVGIGTASPASKLSFGSTIGLDFAVYEGAGGANKYGIGMGGAGTSPNPYRTRLYANGVEYLSIDTNGNVGINTVAPTNFGGKNLSIVAQANNAYASTLWVSGAYVMEALVNEASSVMSIGARSSHKLDLCTSDTTRMTISAAGYVAIGRATTNTIRLFVQGSTTGSSDYTFACYNSSEQNLFYVRNDGAFSTGTASLSPYNLTTGNAANVYLDAAGVLNRSTSSLRYKTDVADASHGLADVLKLRSVTYKGKNDGEKTFGGLIAEEVHDAGLTEFVAYDNEGLPDALHYGNMVALAFKAIQELKAENDALKARIEALETK